MIKKLLVILAVSTVTVGMTLLAANHYEAYQSKQREQATITAKAKAETQAAVKASEQAARAVLEKRLADLRVECNKGVAAYAKLTAWTKKQVPAPVCN